MAYHQHSHYQTPQQTYTGPGNEFRTNQDSQGQYDYGHGYGYGDQVLGHDESLDMGGQHGYYEVEGEYPHHSVQDSYGPVQPGGYGREYDQQAYNQHNSNNGPPRQQWQEQPTHRGNNPTMPQDYHRNGAAPYSNHHPPNGYNNNGYPVTSGDENYRGHSVTSSQQPRKGPPKEQRRPAQSKPSKAPPEQRARDRRPSSPKLMSWDNPFPAFPGNKKKKVQEEEHKMNEMMSGLNVEDKKRTEDSAKKIVKADAASSGGTQGSLKGSWPRGRDEVQQPDARNVHSGPRDTGVPNYSGPHAYTRYDQDLANQQPPQAQQPPRVRQERQRPPEPRASRPPRAQPSGHHGGAPLSPTRGQFGQNVQGNQYPTHVQPQRNDPRDNSALQQRSGEWTPPATGAGYSSDDGHARMRQAPNVVLQPPPFTRHARSDETHYARSPTGPVELDSEPVAASNAQQPDYLHPTHAPVAHELPADDAQLLHNERRLSEIDMPNFDAAPAMPSGHRRGMSFEWHLSKQSHEPAGAPPVQVPIQTPITHEQYPSSDLAGQASRSRSHPNLRSQNVPGSSGAYAVEMAGDIPRVPTMPLLGKTLQSPQYGREEHHAGAQHYSDLEVIPQGQDRGRQQVTVPSGLPTQRRAGPQAGRFHPGNQPRSPDTVRSAPDMNSPTAAAPAPRPFNPDALPEHPTPIRAGLMAGPVVTPPSKPPPLRQYNNTTPPTSSQASIPQANAARTPEKPPPVTHAELERLRKAVKANPSDRKTQLLLASKLEEAMVVLADNSGRADLKTRNKNRERWSMEALKIVKKLASAGYPDAMFYMADCYGTGRLGLEVDPKEAFNLYQTAAKAGHGPSAYRAAVCCEMGPESGGGTRKDPLKAFAWYKKAALLGDTPAMYKMGMVMLKGLMSQPKSPNEGVIWLKRAAEKADEENPHAVHELALLYEKGSSSDHIARDEPYSRQLFIQAAELGYKYSQFRLGSAYEYGLMGLPIDPRHSIAWYSKAAVQGEHQSELALSGWYLTGSEGVLQQSDTEAYLWARKAAQAGLAKAEYAMGYFTEVGIGAPANLEEAKKWYWRAADHGFVQARQRLEDLRHGGGPVQQRERISRSKVGKQHEGECSVM